MWESTAYLKTVAIAEIAHKGRLPRRYAPRNDGTTLNYIIPFFHSMPYRINRRKRGDLEISPFGFIFAAQTTS